MDSAELDALRRAKAILEKPGLAMRIADKLGTPVDALLRRLPATAQGAITNATRKALEKSLTIALRTLDADDHRAPVDWLHRGAVMATGAAGGAVGLAGLAIELPVSLTLMLRSVADHARAEGEDLRDVAARLECLTVFAYGTPSRGDDAAESAYFAVRAALARAVSQAAEYVAGRGVAEAVSERSAPALVQLIARIAPRLGIAVTDKAAAQLVPVAGAAGGAAVNALFMHHYQSVAWAHFTMRRLERAYGAEAVRQRYEALR